MIDATTATDRKAIRRDRGALESALAATGATIRGSAFTCPHPDHDDANASGSIYADDAGVWRGKCHACGWSGDVFDVRALAEGRPVADVLRDANGSDLPKPAKRNGTPRKPATIHATAEAAADVALWGVRKDKGDGWALTRTYVYRDAEGVEYARVLRFDAPDGSDKTFRPLACEGDGWRLGDPAQWLPYRIDELPPDGIICITEGEKAADALWSVSIPATTSAHGSKSPHKTQWQSLAGRDAVIWPDRDKAGEQYAEAVASILARLDTPARVRVIAPPEDLPDGGDAFDYIEARECIASEDIAHHLRGLAEAAALWTPPAEPEDTADAGESDADPAPILDPADPLPAARELVAAKFTAHNRRVIVHHRGEFVAWRGSHYAPLPDAELRAEAYRFAEQAVTMKRVGDDWQCVPFKPTKPKIENLLDALRAVAVLPGDVDAPAWLDAKPGDPDPAALVALSNGLYELPTDELHPHNPRLYNRHALPFDFEADAGEPTAWLRFLADLWPDDPEAARTLRQWFGYCLTADTRQEKILLCVGPKRSGKGTIARILTALIGHANVAGPTLASLSQNFGLAPLVDKPLAIISDARLSGRADQSVIAERLLSVSGEDGVTVDRKHREAWTGKLPTRFMVLTNELPRLADASGALASRFVVLTLSRSFYGREDHDLTDKLMRELPAIFRWAVEGWRDLQSAGRFITPASSAEAVAELEDLGSPVGAFIRERCIVEPGRGIDTKRLYEAWKDWCNAEGREHPGTAASFGRDLRAAVPGLRTSDRRNGAIRWRSFEGIDLNE